MDYFQKINKIIIIMIVVYFVLFFSMWFLFLSIRSYNEEYDNGHLFPYQQNYCLNNTEYRLNDVTIDEFISQFRSIIQRDSAACYRKRKVLIINERNQTKREEYRIDTMTVEWSRLGSFSNMGKGPRCCQISIFLPYTGKVNDKYSDKQLFMFKVIDTKPVTVIIPRPIYAPNSFTGWIFGYYELDLSEFIEVNRYIKYFRIHYLDNHFQYNSLTIKNCFFVFVLLIISTTRYLFELFVFILIWIGLNILHRWSQP